MRDKLPLPAGDLLHRLHSCDDVFNGVASDERLTLRRLSAIHFRFKVITVVVGVKGGIDFNVHAVFFLQNTPRHWIVSIV